MQQTVDVVPNPYKGNIAAQNAHRLLGLPHSVTCLARELAVKAVKLAYGPYGRQAFLEVVRKIIREQPSQVLEVT